MARERNVSSIEKHQVKISLGVAAVVIIFLMTMSVNFASWKTHMEDEHKALSARQDHIAEKYVSIRAEVDMLEEAADQRDVQMATINAKLANIEALLLELRNDLKSHDIN